MPARPLHHARQPQRLLVVGQRLLQRGLGPEVAEEGCDAHQHQRGGGGLGVGHQAAAAQLAGVGQQQRHQRVGGDQLAQAVGVHLVLYGAQLLQRLGGFGQHRISAVAKASTQASSVGRGR
jgi:hypothetical protein